MTAWNIKQKALVRPLLWNVDDDNLSSILHVPLNITRNRVSFYYILSVEFHWKKNFLKSEKILSRTLRARLYRARCHVCKLAPIFIFSKTQQSGEINSCYSLKNCFGSEGFLYFFVRASGRLSRISGKSFVFELEREINLRGKQPTNIILVKMEICFDCRHSVYMAINRGFCLLFKSFCG